MKPEGTTSFFCCLCGSGIVTALLFLTMQVSRDNSQSPADHECGSPLPARITHTFTGPHASVPPAFPVPTIILEAVLPNASRSRIMMRIERPAGSQPPSQYTSDDRGETWHPVDWVLGYSNLPVRSESEGLMSHVDRKVLYDCYYICKNGFKLSKDGGVTWTHINPTLSGKDAIEEIELIGTGTHSAGRVYAIVWTDGRKNFKAAVSNDYGHSFDLLDREVGFVVETRADPNVLYAALPSKELLGVSRDGGASWIPLQASNEFWKALFFNSSDRRIRGWKEYPSDQEWPTLTKIVQIESDPTHAQWIYVLTEKGLYLSRNGGQEFRLASLVLGQLRSIDRIAVDPSDGRFVFAVVDYGKFYRSSDYGCSWKQMPLPNPASN